MKIITHECPDTTYFKTSEVAPYFQGETLHIYEGRGRWRSSWGAPSVTTKIKTIGETEEIIQITVTGWHKHTIAPVGGNYYFVKEKEGWVRKRANAKIVKEALLKGQQP